MIRYTIEVRHGAMTARPVKMIKARLYWRGAGIEIYALGPLTGALYEQAANLAMNLAEGHRIPASSLKRADCKCNRRRGLQSDTKSMFE